MNKPFPAQSALNFAAVSFAIQYYSHEHQLAHAFKNGVLPLSNKAIPKSQVIRDWVAHFSVARNFTGFGILSAESREQAYGKIHDLVWMHGPRGDDESIVDRAARVERVLCNELGVKSSLLSATTKLLWLIDRESIIYDGILRKKLNTPDGDYKAFCEKWESEYRTVSSGLEAAVAALAQSTHLFPDSWDLQRDSRQPWFSRRVFDTFHWLD